MPQLAQTRPIISAVDCLLSPIADIRAKSLWHARSIRPPIATIALGNLACDRFSARLQLPLSTLAVALPMVGDHSLAIHAASDSLRQRWGCWPRIIAPVSRRKNGRHSFSAIHTSGCIRASAPRAIRSGPRSRRSGRDFSAWIGLVPKQSSSGGKEKLGNITKQGDRYLRSLFTVGAIAVIRYAKLRGTDHRPWLTALLARRPTKVAAIALANKIARMVWAMMTMASAIRNPSRWRRDRDRVGLPA
jgi:Transposase IS116/IS110/IS902 family